ncbi:TIGR03936 family radical SAM-associated protein [Acetobacterium bakii]|uniref:TIGR03936 family radical SAM-associated protein n=1 Tax=Acetobacterium bakii TaxID=52689 RepID=UPI0006811783|nr:TIGR03936 family radical SAM-associated protein [Acetobacterium bakii]
MIKMQYQFKRTNELRFLSHLDQQRLFQRAFRRSDMQVDYSLGFNPHPKMAFALAMSVGLTSDCEYGDVMLTDDISCEAFIERMNAVLPQGLEIVSARILEEGHPSLSASLLKSHYQLKVKLSDTVSKETLSKAFQTYLDYPEILMKKRNKKGKLIEKNIRPFIESILLNQEETTEEAATIEMFLNYIEQQCVKPELILSSINEQVNDLFIIDPTIQIHRKNLMLLED